MTLMKSMAKVAGVACLLFALNGWINYSLMKPLDGGSEAFNRFRYHLDDAGFVLLFVFVAVVFWAMFAVLPQERGYLYLGFISVLTSLQLFMEWDDKSLLFGPIPEIPYDSLAIKSGVTYLSFSLVAHLLRTAKRPITRVFLWAGGVLWATILAASLFTAGDSWSPVLNRLFLAVVLSNMALCVWQFLTLLRRKEHQAELRRIAIGFVLFSIVLLPDPGKDLLEDIAGHGLGYNMVYWEQCLEDTFPWALLSLVSVFGTVFLRRFVQTLKDIKFVSEELRSNNAVLLQEVDTRQRLDQLLTQLLRTYRVADLEQAVIREGRDFFRPHAFVLVKVDETEGASRFEGADGPTPDEGVIGEALRRAGSRLPAGEAIVTPAMVLGSAGGTEGMRLFLAVYAADGGPVAVEERERFALLLMSKYVSIFYEYFHLLESRLKEMEQRQANRAPWLSKLFMQIAEKERKRLASDLHDEVLQELLHIRRVMDRATDEPGAEDYKARLRLGLDNAEFMIRETCRELMPSFLSDHGVLHAVGKLVETTRLRADFQLIFQATPLSASLDSEQTTAIYRVVQELINNAVKHSEAGRVILELEQREGILHIRYADDGVGMDTDIDFSFTDRFGLSGIMERIRMVGGEVTVQSEPGQGVKIGCSIPV